MRLSRQFRDKEDEYFNFQIITSTSPDTVRLDMEVATTNMKPGSYHRIDWGDGSDPEPLGFASFLEHTYATAGTYDVKVWTREKYRNIRSFEGYFFPYEIPTLDFSDFRWLYAIQPPSSGTVGSLTIPTAYDGTFGFIWNNVGCNVTFTDTLLDLTPWAKISRIRQFADTTNIDRIKLPIPSSTQTAQFYWLGDQISAVGPNADNLSNFEADFTNYGIQQDFVLTGTGTAPTSVSLPASAFSSGGFTNSFRIENTAVTTLDLTHLKGSSASGVFLGFSDNANLVSITWPTSYGTGTFDSVSCFNSPNFTGTWDFSWFGGFDNGLTMTLSSGQATAVILPSSSSTIRYIYCDNTDISTINFTVAPNATEQNDFELRAFNNNMTAAEVNQILVDLDTNSTNAFTNRIISIAGTNAAPDTTSGGLNGSAAKTNLVGKGFTVTTN